MGVTLRHHFSNSHSALRHEYSAGRTATDGPAIVRTCGSGGAVTDCPLLCSHCSAEGLPQRGSGFPLEYRCSPCLRHLPRRVSLTSVLNSDAFDAELPRRVSLTSVLIPILDPPHPDPTTHCTPTSLHWIVHCPGPPHHQSTFAAAPEPPTVAPTGGGVGGVEWGVGGTCSDRGPGVVVWRTSSPPQKRVG